jgi:hypothetical protein
MIKFQTDDVEHKLLIDAQACSREKGKSVVVSSKGKGLALFSAFRISQSLRSIVLLRPIENEEFPIECLPYVYCPSIFSLIPQFTIGYEGCTISRSLSEDCSIV